MSFREEFNSTLLNFPSWSTQALLYFGQISPSVNLKFLKSFISEIIRSRTRKYVKRHGQNLRVITYTKTEAEKRNERGLKRAQLILQPN